MPECLCISEVELQESQASLFYCFPGGSDGKVFAYNLGNPGLVPGLGISSAEGNDTQSIILAWEIPWTEERNKLQSMGLQRVGHD